jgi:hypothetical protein
MQRRERGDPAGRKLVNKAFQMSLLGRRPGFRESLAAENYCRKNQPPKKFLKLLSKGRTHLFSVSLEGSAARDPVSSNQS